MQLVVLLCCVAVAMVAPVPCKDLARKICETQVLLRSFQTTAGLQTIDSKLNHLSLNIKLGCCVAALTCYRENLKNATAQPRNESAMKLFNSLESRSLSKSVQCKDPGHTTAPCPACESFPRTDAELVYQLNQFLQMAQSRLSTNSQSGRS